ncbi:hypothetical protein E2320_007932 [Naja naja]|nr:hypothetical protein E2320_007932 [Naja naja]
MSREDPGAQRAEENSSRVILAVFLALLIDLLGFTLILPLLPSILDHFSKHDDGLYRRVQAGVDWFSGSLGIPPERKYNSVLFGGRKFPLLQGGAFVGHLAMIGLAFSLGFTLGPMLGAFLALETEKDQVFYTRAAIFATIFAVADFLFILTCLPETLPKEKRILGLVYFLYLFLFSGLDLEQGKMFFFIGVTMAVIQGGYTRRITPGAELRMVKIVTAAVVVPCLSTVVSSYGKPTAFRCHILWPSDATFLALELNGIAAALWVLHLLERAALYWLAGAEVCFTVCASLFLLPFVLLRCMPKQSKQE